MQSLVIQTSFLGDVVLTTPLIGELASRGPVDVVVTPAAAPLLANHPDIRDLLVFDKRGAHGGLGGLWRFSRTLRAWEDGTPRRYAAAYLAQGSWRSAALAKLAGVTERVGFDSSDGRPFYTKRIPYDATMHHAERLWRLSSPPAGPPVADSMRLRLYPGDNERRAVDALLAAVPHDSAPFVALAPGSIWGTKRWPHFADLAARLAPLFHLVVIGSAADAPLAADIAKACKQLHVIDATGKLSLLASAELIGRCAAIVTNDSAPQHLASAMRTPTITIFGPTVPAFGFGPLAPRHTSEGLRDLSCRPCHAHGPAVCPLGHWRCMRDLPAERVELALHTLLKS